MVKVYIVVQDLKMMLGMKRNIILLEESKW